MDAEAKKNKTATETPEATLSCDHSEASEDHRDKRGGESLAMETMSC